MSTNLSVPQARKARICGVWGREAAWGEGSIYSPLERWNCLGAYWEPSVQLLRIPALPRKVWGQLRPRTTSWLDNDLFFCQTTEAWLAFRASISSCLFLEATQCPWRWEGDLEPSRGKRPSFYSPSQCGFFCLLYRLITDSGKEGRQTSSIEPCVWKKQEGPQPRGRVPRRLTL